MLRSRSALALLSAATLVAAPLVLADAEDDPALDLGVPFGSARISSSLDTVDQRPDVDVFEQDLVEGARIKLKLTAAKGSSLRPEVEVEGPDGIVRQVKTKSIKGGRGVKVGPVDVGLTGAWLVRVRGADDTTGGYDAKFATKAAKVRVKAKKQVVGDGAQVEHEFEAASGSSLVVKLKQRTKDGTVEVVGLRTPDDDVLPLADQAAKRRSIQKIDDIVLDGPTGTWALIVEGDGAEIGYDLQLKVRPPERPRGKQELSPFEPQIDTDDVYETNAGKSLTLIGAHLSRDPRPEVWIGGRPADVLSVGGTGTGMIVSVGSFQVGELLDVVVQNGDGQAACFRDVIEITPVPEPDPEPDPDPDPDPDPVPVLSSLTPGSVTLETEDSQTFTVGLDVAAPAGGQAVPITLTGGIGTAPGSVAIREGETSGTFEFFAGDAEATGQVRVSLRGVTLTADVTVEAPPPPPEQIDISGWEIVQANSSRTYTIPNGTVLRKGEYLVLGRNATKSAFETHWGVTLGSGVTFVTSGNLEVPAVNGGESYELRNSVGGTVDGPTTSMRASGGENYQRTAGQPAGNAGSWAISTSPASAATPGSGQSLGSTAHGVYISEFSDATGQGAFVYEFVELYYDGDAAE